MFITLMIYILYFLSPHAIFFPAFSFPNLRPLKSTKWPQFKHKLRLAKSSTNKFKLKSITNHNKQNPNHLSELAITVKQTQTHNIYNPTNDFR